LLCLTETNNFIIAFPFCKTTGCPVKKIFRRLANLDCSHFFVIFFQSYSAKFNEMLVLPSSILHKLFFLPTKLWCVYLYHWWGNLRERGHWGDQDVDGRIILRWIFRKLEGVMGTGWSWLRIGTGGGHL
jgi:hypothetical protein